MTLASDLDRSPRSFFSWIGLLIAAMLVVGPIAIVIGTSTGLVDLRLGGESRFGFDYFEAVFSDPNIRGDILDTLFLAGAGTVLALVFGVSLAIISTRLDVPGTRSRLAQALPLVSFLVAPILVFLAWHVLYQDRAGLVNTAIRAITGSEAEAGPLKLLTLPALVGAMGVLLVPVVYISVQGALRAGSSDLELAARASGASWHRVIRTVTLPLMRENILAAALLAFVLGLATFTVPATIRIPGVSTISLDIARFVGSAPARHGQASVLALVLLGICIAALALRERVGRSKGTVVPLRPSAGTKGGQRRIEIGPAKYLAAALFFGFCLFAVILPILGVISLSFRGYWSTEFSSDAFSFDNYREFATIAPSAAAALRNSAIVAVIGASLSIALGLFFARLISRPGRLSRVVGFLTFLPAGVPQIAIGLSILIVSLRVVPDLYGSPFPLLAVFVIMLLPFAVQVPLAGLRRVPRELEWASAVCGASPRMTTLKIVMPLVAVDLVAGWILLATIMVREVDAAVMLTNTQFPVAGPTMLRLWEDGSNPEAAAMGTLMLLITISLSLFGLLTLQLFRWSLRAKSWLASRDTRWTPDGTPLKKTAGGLAAGEIVSRPSLLSRAADIGAGGSHTDSDI